MSTLATAYQSHHRPGRDCRMTALRNTFSFHGAAETYASIFGLSGTFGFGFHASSFGLLERLSAPDCDTTEHYLPVVGYGQDCMRGLASTFHATLVYREQDEEEQSFESLAELTREGLPVMVAVHRTYLNSAAARDLPSPETFLNVSFGNHWVVLVHCDRAARAVTYFDSDAMEPITVSEEAFRQARTIGDADRSCFLKSRAAWAVCLPPERRPQREQMVLQCLTRVHARMSANTSASTAGGLVMLARFAEVLPGLRKDDAMPLSKLLATAIMLRFHAKTLTGGGLGRRLFGSFLRTEGKTMGNPLLLAAAERCVDLAERWDTLSDAVYREVIDNANADLRAMNCLPERLHALVNGETALMNTIGEYVCMN